jgi:hypothetical protein
MQSNHTDREEFSMSSHPMSWKTLSLQQRLQFLIQGLLLIILLSAQQWLIHEFERTGIKAAEERTNAVADGVTNGLNTLMEIEIGGKDVISDKNSRGLFIKQLGVSDKLLELRVVRAKGTNDEFGEGLPEEKPVDDIDRAVLASGKRLFKLNVTDGGDASLRAVIPSIAMKSFRSSKCLECQV